MKLFFDVVEEEENTSKNDPSTLKHLLDNAKFQLKLKEQEIFNLKEDVVKNKSHNTELREEIKKRNEEQKDQAALICSLEVLSFLKILALILGSFLLEYHLFRSTDLLSQLCENIFQGCFLYCLCLLLGFDTSTHSNFFSTLSFPTYQGVLEILELVFSQVF